MLDRALKAYRYMCGSKGGSIHNMLGLMAGNVPRLRQFKFCRECNAEAMESKGELYFNRLHQLSTVLFCPIHEIPLMRSVVNVKQYNRHEFVYPDVELMRTGLVCEYTASDKNILIEISKMYRKLIELKVDLHSINFRSIYLDLLSTKGFIRGSCMVDMSELLFEFSNTFPPTLLQTLSSSDIANWLPTIVRKHRKSFHPIRHMLMLLFLGISLEEFTKKGSQSRSIPDKGSIGVLRSKTAYYDDWLFLQRKYPEKSKNELRKISPKTYTWLYRYDRVWLDSNSPARRKPVSINKRVNWAQRDKNLSVEVVSAIDIIKASERPFVRISTSRIGKMIGKLNIIEKHLNRLPLTREIIEKAVESVEEFQKRKIRQVIVDMVANGEPLYESHVYRRATVNKGRNAVIDSYVYTLLKHYDQALNINNII